MKQLYFKKIYLFPFFPKESYETSVVCQRYCEVGFLCFPATKKGDKEQKKETTTTKTQVTASDIVDLNTGTGIGPELTTDASQRIWKLQKTSSSKLEEHNRGPIQFILSIILLACVPLLGAYSGKYLYLDTTVLCKDSGSHPQNRTK